MDTKKLNEMVERNIEEVENDYDVELTEEELELSRKILAQLSGYYVRKDQKVAELRKAKAKNRAANKTAKQSRRKNRK